VQLKRSTRDGLLYFFGITNLAVYLFVSASLPFDEILDNIMGKGSGHAAYYFHFISLLPVLWVLPQLYRIEKKRNAKFCAWVFTALLTYMLSSEILLEVLFARSPVSAGNLAYDTALADALLQQFDALKTAVYKIAYPVAWGLLAFVLLSFGIKRRYRELRISALALLGLTIAKLFVYDIRNVSEAGKIAAFILLGVVLLVISFMYQKIKAILLTDENETAVVDTP
jgi:hypothetical protein